MRINDTNGPYFVGGKGSSKETPSPPYFFNHVEDAFSRILAKAIIANIIRGIIPYIIPMSLISLQCVDDTILFLDPDPAYAKKT